MVRFAITLDTESVFPSQPIHQMRAYIKGLPNTFPYVPVDAGRATSVQTHGPVLLQDILNILKQGQSSAGPLDWSNKQFPVSPPPVLAIPVEPTKPAPPVYEEWPPRPTDPEWWLFAPSLSVAQKIMVFPALSKFAKARQALKAAQKRYPAALATFNKTASEIENRNGQLKARHDAALALAEQKLQYWNQQSAEFKELQRVASQRWSALKVSYESLQESDAIRIAALRAKFRLGDPISIERVIHAVLARSAYPHCFPFSVDSIYEQGTRILALDYLLPNMLEFDLRKTDKRTGKLAACTKSEVKAASNEVPLAIAIRSIYEIVKADSAAHIDAIAFNGLLRYTDPATGHIKTDCILSLFAKRSQIEQLSISNIDPAQCFRALKGISGAQLGDRIAVAPIMKLMKGDRRVIDGREIIANTASDANLAAMDWEDFEHFVRQIFEKEFARDGVEVRVTQSSRDRGVDALAYDPDPLRGGKLVIQAKRYTQTVDVAAVRDLFGTIHNEGANRGILVTTSSFGPDSREFAKDKPITLVDGANLLHLLRKHGYSFRIDLEEARRLRSAAGPRN